MARFGTNMSVAIEASRDTAITVTAVTKASPGVATATAHGLTNGDIVIFACPTGMVELDGQAVRVSAADTNTFTLEGLDTSAYTDWGTGTATEILTWTTISGAQSVSMPDPAPNKIDITTLIDKTKQYGYGLPDAPDGTINGLYDPANAGVAIIKAATKANAAKVFRISWAGGQKTYFNANVSGGSGFDLQANAAATATISFTPVRDVMDYAS